MNAISRYFDSLTAPMFKTDEAGRHLFFPAGIWSKGRIVGDAAASERLKARIRKAYMLLFLVAIPLTVIVALSVPGASGWPFYIGVGAVVGIIFNIVVFSLARGMEKTDARMTMKDAYSAQAKALGTGWLKALAIGSGILAAGGGAMAVFATGTERRDGLIALVLFSACLVLFVMQLRKAQQASGQGTDRAANAGC